MKNIIEFLQRNCNKSPDKIFCVDDEDSYTYAKALQIVKNIASFFADKNIQNQPIMIRAERNNKTLLSILAIIMSNNYYVPVNPDFSKEKVESVIESSHINYELITDDNVEIFTNEHFYYDDCVKFKADENLLDNVSKNYDINNNIYTIYTSGSTGKPKGVAKSHKNVIAFVTNFLQTFNLPEDLKIANQSPLFFDASMKDVFITLIGGGGIYFPNKTLFSMPMKLIEYLNANCINFICWVPSALTIIVRLNTFKYIKPQFLKFVMFVGEVFLPKYLNMWLQELPEITYVNLYGSTEIAGVCLYKIIDRPLPEDKAIPLGKPLANNKVYLVDGEIVVESDQIALYYVNDEEKNKTVFENFEGVRRLKTGDFAFINDDNDIVFTSRKDFQIKHMGYRIELQEIDIAVSKLKYISNCAVLYNQPADKIVAFVSLNQKVDNPTKSIISDLKNIIPAYMIPNRVVVLDELPLNANGKIDRVKLKQMMGE